ncbi:MAG: hypothetical protein C0498_05535 [Anaerolinea sp.]|nr:hypothetical protein [Anaerolinea sp.]
MARWIAPALWALWLLALLSDLLAGRGLTGFAAGMFVALAAGQVFAWRRGDTLPMEWAVATLTICAVVALAIAIYLATSLQRSPAPAAALVTEAAPSSDVAPTVAVPSPSSASRSPRPLAVRTVRPSVVRSERVDALAPVPVASFSSADLLSVSPDGRSALISANHSSVPQVDLIAVPLSGDAQVNLGVAGWEWRPPDSSEVRLALPAWSADSSAVAFENGPNGKVASLVGAPAIDFTATTDAPITALTGGGFVIGTPAGPRVVAGPDVPLADATGLRDVVYFPDGTSLVGLDEGGNIVWANGSDRIVVAGPPESAFPPAMTLLSRGARALAIAPEDLPLWSAYLVEPDGSITILELADFCSGLALSDDGAYAAYTTCERFAENAGSPAWYSLRVVRLSDGVSVDIGPGAATPVFLPGTNRLVWLGLSGDLPVGPTYTLTVATKELLP